MFRTCGYQDGKMYRTGIPLYQRKRDRSYYIVIDGKRVSVAIINSYGQVILLPKVKES